MSYNVKIMDVAESTAPYYWGIDIGGTGIKLGLVDELGQTVAFSKLPTREGEGPDAAMDLIRDSINETERELGLVGKVPHIGLGSPGPMDLVAGTLVEPPQLPSWWGYRIVDAVTQRLQRPVAFLNDASAAAFGEFWLGTAKEDSSMVLLTLGTGVGGGVIIDSELVNGVNSCGSECGHMIVNPADDAQLCVWGGGRGRLEAYASASGVVQRTRQRLAEGATSSISGMLGGNDCELTAIKVYQAAMDGDALALEIVDETARWLGIGITTIVHITDPGSIVLGGAMNFGGPDCELGRRFLDGIRKEFKLRTFANVYAGTTIKFATLGANAGYLGVAGYARKKHQSTTS